MAKVAPSVSMDELLTTVEKQWTDLGLPYDKVNREVFKTWLDEYGMKMVIVSLMKLAATDPKAYLTQLNQWSEFVMPKTTRVDGTNKGPVSISFTLPSQPAQIESTPKTIHPAPSQYISPVEVVLPPRVDAMPRVMDESK